MVKKLNSLVVRNQLTNKNMWIFTPLQFKALFGVSDSATRKFIHQHTQKGLFEKIRNGFYVLKDEDFSVFELANKIYSPSYISLESALSFYGIIPEAVYSITSVSPKATREFNAVGLSFEYSSIKQPAFCGYFLHNGRTGNFLIAEKEKAATDYFYFVSLGQKHLNDRLDKSKLDWQKVEKWSQSFQSKKLNNLISKLC